MNIEPTPEDNENYDEDIMLYWITSKYLAGDITDDNPSKNNGLTGLDQVIAFNYDLDPDNEDDRFEIEDIRLDIKDRIKYQMNGGSYLENFPIEICEKHDDEIVLELDFDTRIEHFGNLEEYEDWINLVSKKIFEGLLTEDNTSPTNQQSGLDQLITSYLGLDLTQEKDCMAFYIVKLDLRNKEIEYEGGSSHSKTEEQVLNNISVWESE